MKTFTINVRNWFAYAYAVAMKNPTPKFGPESWRMNAANLLAAMSSGRHCEPRQRRRRRARHTRCAYLEFVNRQARRVAIAGSFNDWRPAATPMVPLGRGWWVKGLTLPPGRYQYRFVVDGQWVPDPNATATEPGPDGRDNSVLVVP